MANIDAYYLTLAATWFRPVNSGQGKKFSQLELKGLVESRTVSVPGGKRYEYRAVGVLPKDKPRFDRRPTGPQPTGLLARLTPEQRAIALNPKPSR